MKTLANIFVACGILSLLAATWSIPSAEAGKFSLTALIVIFVGVGLHISNETNK